MPLNLSCCHVVHARPQLRMRSVLVDEFGEDHWACAYPRAPQHLLSSIILIPSILKELEERRVRRGEYEKRQGGDAGIARRSARASADLADAAGRALFAGVSRAAGEGRWFS